MLQTWQFQELCSHALIWTVVLQLLFQQATGVILCIFVSPRVSPLIPISHLLKILEGDGLEAQCDKQQYVMPINKRVPRAD